MVEIVHIHIANGWIEKQLEMFILKMYHGFLASQALLQKVVWGCNKRTVAVLK